MQPRILIHIFAWLAITALAMSIISNFWISILLGAAAVVLLKKLLK
jgi:hypothetical protein